MSTGERFISAKRPLRLTISAMTNAKVTNVNKFPPGLMPMRSKCGVDLFFEDEYRAMIGEQAIDRYKVECITLE